MELYFGNDGLYIVNISTFFPSHFGLASVQTITPQRLTIQTRKNFLELYLFFGKNFNLFLIFHHLRDLSQGVLI